MSVCIVLQEMTGTAWSFQYVIFTARLQALCQAREFALLGHSRPLPPSTTRRPHHQEEEGSREGDEEDEWRDAMWERGSHVPLVTRQSARDLWHLSA